MNDKEITEKLAIVITKVDFIHSDVKELKEDVKGLNALRWKIIGISTVFGAIAGILVEILKR